MVFNKPVEEKSKNKLKRKKLSNGWKVSFISSGCVSFLHTQSYNFVNFRNTANIPRLFRTGLPDQFDFTRHRVGNEPPNKWEFPLISEYKKKTIKGVQKRVE